MTGWAEGPGGGALASAIADAFHRAEQRDRDNLPCPKCGGDRLRADFTDSGRCHAPRAVVARAYGVDGAEDTGTLVEAERWSDGTIRFRTVQLDKRADGDAP